MKNISIWRHVIQQQIKDVNLIIPIGIFFAIFLLIFIVNQPGIAFFKDDRLAFADYIDPILGISTFIIALFIGLVQMRQQWDSKLAKKLSVAFIYRHHDANDSTKKHKQNFIPNEVYLLMYCKEASLTGEGDIRPFSQQITSQINGRRDINFAPYQILHEPELVLDKKSNSYFKHYIFKYFIYNIPDGIKGSKAILDTSTYTGYEVDEHDEFYSFNIDIDMNNYTGMNNYLASKWNKNNTDEA